MANYEYKYIIGEKVKVLNEKNPGVVTKIDVERGLIYVLFPRNREEIYSFPESIEQEVIIPPANKRR